MTATYRFYNGTMNCGKSTLALQIAYNMQAEGKKVLLLGQKDREGQHLISSRLGVSAIAKEIHPGLSIKDSFAGDKYDLIIIDEAQFLTPLQVEELAGFVDNDGVDVYAFGITTDFKSRLFPGAKRLIELVDEVQPLQLFTLCWCGNIGRQNARLLNDEMITEGDQVLIGDILANNNTSYRVLCRKHYLEGKIQ